MICNVTGPGGGGGFMDKPAKKKKRQGIYKDRAILDGIAYTVKKTLNKDWL